MTSQLAVKGAPGMTHDSAAKAGVIGFTRPSRRRSQVKGVLVNAVAPGPVPTSASSVPW